MPGLNAPRTLIAVGASLCSLLFIAADHAEAPATRASPAADINDLYVWADNDSGRLIVILTYGGIQAPAAGQSALFNNEFLYSIHIDTNDDNLPDRSTHIRFGFDPNGNAGVRIDGLPGTTDPIIGAVETVLSAGGGRQVFTGLREDPFFFDLTGFNQTLNTGTLAFDSTRDDFAGNNVSAIVLEMDLNAATGGAPTIAVWATTGSNTPIATAALTGAAASHL